MKFPARSYPHLRHAGLTLLELLIVITILAILTTIASRSLVTVGDQTKFDGNEALTKEFRRALLGTPGAKQSDLTPAISGFIADFGRPPRAPTPTTFPYATEGEANSDPTPAGYTLPDLLSNASALPFGLYPLDSSTLVYTDLVNSTLPGATTTDTTNGSKLAVGWRGPYMQGFSQNYLQDSWGKPITAYSVVGFRYLVDWWVPTYSALTSIAPLMVPPNVDSTGFVSVGYSGPVGDPTAVTGLVVRGGPAVSGAILSTDGYGTNLSVGIVYTNEYVSQLTVLLTVGPGITNAMSASTVPITNCFFSASVLLYSPNPGYRDPTDPSPTSRSFTNAVGVAWGTSITNTYTTVFVGGSPLAVTYNNFASRVNGGSVIKTYPLVHGPKVIKATIRAATNNVSAPTYSVTATSRNIVLRPGFNSIQLYVP